ncbi:MAG: hypothetical protein AABM29_08300 [Actinomycetota bacterium]
MSTKIKMSVATVLGVVAAAFGVAACGSDSNGSTSSNGSEPATQADSSNLPQGSEPVKLDPAEFTTNIDNPYWPMRPGSRWVYNEVHAEDLSVERVVVTVTNRTKKIANGIEARLVRDVVSENGVPTEVTSDYYAQDSAGNIWYLGEDTTEYKNGKPATTAGSFEAGVDGAQPGIALPADPKPGMTYRQEYYAGEAEDKGEVVSVDEQAEPPFGHFTNVLMTKDINPLEPKALEFKFYGRDVGLLTTVGVSGGSKIEELLSYTAG